MSFVQSMIKNIYILFFIFISFDLYSGVMVSPAFIDLGDVTVGKKITIPLTVINTSLEDSEHIKVYIKGSKKDKNEQWDYSSPPNKKNSLADWIKINRTEFDLDPKEEGDASIVIKIPNVDSGDYRATIFVSQDEAKTIAEMNAKFKNDSGKGETTTRVYGLSSIAIPVRARVKNPRSSSVENFKLKKYLKLRALSGSITQEDVPMLKISAELNNNSSYRIESSGTCNLLSKSNKSILESEITNILTFPNEKTELRCLFSEYIPASNYKVRIKLTNTIVKTPHFSVIEKIKKLTVSQQESVILSNAFLKRTDGKTPMPISISPDSIEITPSLSSKNKKYKEKVIVKNLTDEWISVRSFFLKMPEKIVEKSVKIKPKNFKIKPFSEKEVVIESKKTKNNIFGKVVFSSIKHKEKIPASIRYVVQHATSDINFDLEFQGDVVASVSDESLEIYTSVKNNTKFYFKDISFKVRLIDSVLKQEVSESSFYSKHALLPSETTGLHFRTYIPKAGDHELVIYLMHKNKIEKMKKVYLKVSEENGENVYRVIDLNRKDTKTLKE